MDAEHAREEASHIVVGGSSIEWFTFESANEASLSTLNVW
jgi:hypothetical protein